MNQDEYRALVPGDVVIVVKPISDSERTLKGRSFVFKRLSRPAEMAVIADEHGAWWVHPECLIRANTPEFATVNPDELDNAAMPPGFERGK